MITRDTVLFVYHRIARLKLGQIAQHAFDIALLGGACNTASRLCGIQLGFGDDGEFVIGQDEAALHQRRGEHEFFFAGEEGGVVFAHGGDEAVFFQVAGNNFAATETIGEQ